MGGFGGVQSSRVGSFVYSVIIHVALKLGHVFAKTPRSMSNDLVKDHQDDKNCILLRRKNRGSRNPKRTDAIFHGYHLTGGTYQDSQQKTQGFFPKRQEQGPAFPIPKSDVMSKNLYDNQKDAVNFSALKDIR